MDYDKKNLDKLFQYGTKILTELENSASKKNAALENSDTRYKNLRDNLKSLLDNSEEVTH